MDEAKLGAVLTQFAHALVGSYKVADMLEELCDHVCDVLPVDGAGVMLADEHDVLRFVAASDETVRDIEDLQIELGEGPCLHAYSSGEQVVVPDLTDTERFPAFGAGALESGLRAVYSFPMRIGDDHVGALNLYRSRPGALETGEIEAGQVLADIATVYILNARQVERSTQRSEQLQHALESRVIIEQAKGMLAEQHQIPVTEAFQRLRRYARSNSRKLHDVAEAVVHNDLRL
ncbi:MAG: GAF and ANTAR domain-containing protein [Actinomycetota bacterium]|jgi:GAF domain-containing protein|nr:GAF and ANTAR domain-containing protein [Actinomycetota bacterium]